MLYFVFVSDPCRRSGVCELRRNVDPALEAGWHWTLPLQRLWPLLQDEWTEQTTHQTQEEAGKSKHSNLYRPEIYPREPFTLRTVYQYMVISSMS